MYWFEQSRLPENWQEGDRWRFYWMVTRLGFLASLVIGFHTSMVLIISFIGVLEPLSTETRYMATSIWATFLLTFALIVVYRDIGETQAEQRDLQEQVAKIHNQQKEIMSNQEEWMKAGNRPIVSIDHWFPNGNEVAFFMLNLGMGGTRNLECEFVIYPPEESETIGEIKLKDHLRDESNARALPQTKNPKKFRTSPTVIDAYNEFKEDQSFTSVCSGLIEHNVTYSIGVSFEDLTGETKEIEIITARSTIDDEEMTIEGLVLNTFEVYSSGIDVGPVDIDGIELSEL